MSTDANTPAAKRPAAKTGTTTKTTSKAQSYDITQSAETLDLAKDLAKFIKDNKLSAEVQGKNFVNVALPSAHSRELADVFTERKRQINKFGPQNRTPYQWFLILAEEVGEVAKECVEIEFDDAQHPHADPERFYKELTEVAAVALAAMQNFNQRRKEVSNE